MRLGLVADAEVLSFSPLYFRRIYALPYETYVPRELGEIRKGIQERHWTGFNVTTPFKEKIVPLLDELSPVAEAIQAVNTVVISPDGRWKGHNTDYQAALYLLGEFANIYLPWQAVFILGTGGAARAVALAHKELFPNLPIFFITRSLQRDKLAFPHSYHLLSYEECPNYTFPERPMIVQATPAGMFPHVLSLPPFPISRIQKGWIVWDLIYNPSPTYFLQLSYKQGASIETGFLFFRKQAECSLQLWTETWCTIHSKTD
ncbi:MAG: hypothetical protein RMJ66_07215 [Bacteroidia bacterium]|nr:hypothetical protein [Bacteroidia bacterium]MDW8134843.1 hypothetical protein [Bacteroidia bacterium]